VYRPIYNAMERRIYGIVANQCNMLYDKIDLLQKHIEYQNSLRIKELSRRNTKRGSNDGKK